MVGVNGMFYKVSDVIPTKSDVVNGTITLSNGSAITITSDMTGLTDGDSFTIAEFAFVIASAGVFSDKGFSFPETGIYFLLGSNVHTSELVYSSTKTIAPQYLPSDAILPSVTAADNGKVLKVVNGVWTAVAE